MNISTNTLVLNENIFALPAPTTAVSLANHTQGIYFLEITIGQQAVETHKIIRL